jgi:hypothetical protein
MRTYLKTNSFTKKDWWTGRLAQGVGPEFKPHYRAEEKKKN